MPKKPPRLGRGLDALLSGDPDEPGDVLSLGIGRITPNPYQPRRDFDQERLRELAESIATHGVVQPIIVRQAGDQYELVAGERRWRAAKLAGLKEIPALLQELSDRDVMEIALIENLQREDLNPVEEARAYQVLQDEFGLTQKELAERVGVSRPQVANMLRLLHLPDGVRQMIADGQLSVGHAKVILGLAEEEREEFARAIAEAGASVREAERLAQRRYAERNDPPREKAREIDVFLRDLERRLSAALSARVSLKNRGNRGRIVIEYRDEEELERLIEVLGIAQDE
ncbi:MAG: ParB/RepB/Spo0J family partition protein [Bacillota bacterium]